MAGAAAAAGGGGGLLGGLFGFVEVDETISTQEGAHESKEKKKRSWRRVDEIPHRIPTDSRGKKMYKPHATITKAQMSTRSGTQDLLTKTTQAAMRSRYGDTIRFAKSSTSTKDTGSCASYNTNETCTGHIEFPLNPEKQRCSWCVAMTKNAFGVTSRCVSCAEVGKMETLKFSCSPSNKICNQKDKSKKKTYKDVKKIEKSTIKKVDDVPLPVKAIIEEVSGNAIAALGPTLHLPLSINLHRHLNSTISRAAGRSLTQTMTTLLTQRLTSSLAQSLMRKFILSL
jgi:hypothetical protein